MTTNYLIPSPMTSEREVLMQQRAAAGKSLAQADDQPEVTASIQRRHSSQRKDGMATTARKVGAHKKGPQKDSRFDNEGDAIEVETDTVYWDRYFATSPGSHNARLAMENLLATRG